MIYILQHKETFSSQTHAWWRHRSGCTSAPACKQHYPLRYIVIATLSLLYQYCYITILLLDYIIIFALNNHCCDYLRAKTMPSPVNRYFQASEDEICRLGQMNVEVALQFPISGRSDLLMTKQKSQFRHPDYL